MGRSQDSLTGVTLAVKGLRIFHRCGTPHLRGYRVGPTGLSCEEPLGGKRLGVEPCSYVLACVCVRPVQRRASSGRTACELRACCSRELRPCYVLVVHPSVQAALRSYALVSAR
jgi:hypothetical protein